jgi:hypothetical protein
MNGPGLRTRDDLVSECSALIVTRKMIYNVVEVKTLEKGRHLIGVVNDSCHSLMLTGEQMDELGLFQIP